MNTITIYRALIFAACLFSGLLAIAAQSVDPAKLLDKVTITPGQKMALLFDVQGDVLTKPRNAERPDEKQPGILLTFGQHEGVPGLILSMKHDFPRTLTCRCLMRLKGRKEFVETSILPVKSQMAHYESWTDPIEEIVLFEFKLLEN
ncbi:MAG: hypothetical protein WC657_09705 [Candidatus Paceibacterota bacterium]|jgi:hypothetical protein